MYNLGIGLYAFFVRLIAPFHRKAKLMLRGQRETYRILREKIDKNADYIWFHVASLGEFEQARPMIEAVKRAFPHDKILLSFFSPSGYEVCKNYPLADVVCYLPFDKRRNVHQFLDLAKPKITIFVKYEFWYNFIYALYRQKTPVYLISSVFRPNQLFFKKYAGSYAKILRYYNHIFVQDDTSKTILAQNGIRNVTVTGDTRIDRVIEIREKAKPLPLVEAFLSKKAADLVFIAGSSWAADEAIFIDYFNTHPRLKLIIAPHEIHASHLEEIETKLQRPSIRYSVANEENIHEKDCLIVDCFGLLSSIYRYADIAYIGGGFGVGIHNLPEAAVYGIPVIFGPNYHKFREAHGLITAGGGFSICNKTEFEAKMNDFLQSRQTINEAGEKSRAYIHNNAGATHKIMKKIKFKTLCSS